MQYVAVDSLVCLWTSRWRLCVADGGGRGHLGGGGGRGHSWGYRPHGCWLPHRGGGVLVLWHRLTVHLYRKSQPCRMCCTLSDRVSAKGWDLHHIGIIHNNHDQIAPPVPAIIPKRLECVKLVLNCEVKKHTVEAFNDRVSFNTTLISTHTTSCKITRWSQYNRVMLTKIQQNVIFNTFSFFTS